MSTSASRKIAISQQRYSTSEDLQGSSQRYKPSKRPLNRQPHQTTGNTSGLLYISLNKVPTPTAPAPSTSSSALSIASSASISASSLSSMSLNPSFKSLKCLNLTLMGSQGLLELLNGGPGNAFSPNSSNTSSSSSLSSSFDDDKANCVLELQFQPDEMDNAVHQASENYVEKEKKEEKPSFEISKEKLQFHIKSKLIRQLINEKHRKTNKNCLDALDSILCQINGGWHRLEYRKERARVLAGKQPPVVGFQIVKVNFVADGASSSSTQEIENEDKMEQQDLEINENQENINNNNNNTNRTLALQRFSPSSLSTTAINTSPPAFLDSIFTDASAVFTESTLAPIINYVDPEHVALPPPHVGIFIIPANQQTRNNTADKNKNNSNIKTTTATPVETNYYTQILSEIETTTQQWKELAHIMSCPTIDNDNLIESMDSAWYGFDPGSRCCNSRSLWGGNKRTYSIESSNSTAIISGSSSPSAAASTTSTATATETTTTTTTSIASKKKGLMSKFRSWVKKVTPKELEFLNEALL